MKIAILLFGHLRTFEYSGKYLMENLANKYDCDIFIHTWDEIDSNTKCWENRKRHNLQLNDVVVNKIKEIYKPKKLEIGHQDIQKDCLVVSSDGRKEVSLTGMKYMFESMKSANNLRKEYEQATETTYDYVLVTRPDVAIYNYLDIAETINEAKSLNIDIKNARFFCGLYGSSKTNVRLLINRVCDILFFAVSEVIDRYISANSNLIFDDINKNFKNVVSIYVGNEIKAGIIPYECCFEIDRDWKNHTPESLKILFKTKKSKFYKFFHFYWLRGKK
ncbi:MAG: hypothetical protein NC218_07625 [Acetobacter sp.]|nr:hypothetical protein [Acetobacter sp.]